MQELTSIIQGYESRQDTQTMRFLRLFYDRYHLFRNPIRLILTSQ